MSTILSADYGSETQRTSVFSSYGLWTTMSYSFRTVCGLQYTWDIISHCSQLLEKEFAENDAHSPSAQSTRLSAQRGPRISENPHVRHWWQTRSLRGSGVFVEAGVAGMVSNGLDETYIT